MRPHRIRRHRHAHHPAHRVIFGLGVIGIGTLALLDNLHLFGMPLLRTFWPLALVLFGLSRIVWPRHSGSWLFGLALVIVGSVMTAQNLDLVSIRLRDWWPVFIILAGASILLRGLFPRYRREAFVDTPSSLEHVVGQGLHFLAVLARGIEGRDQTARGGAGDEVDLDAVLLEHLDDADVGEAARRATAQGQADAGRLGRGFDDGRRLGRRRRGNDDGRLGRLRRQHGAAGQNGDQGGQAGTADEGRSHGRKGKRAHDNRAWGSSPQLSL